MLLMCEFLVIIMIIYYQFSGPGRAVSCVCDQ